MGNENEVVEYRDPFTGEWVPVVSGSLVTPLKQLGAHLAGLIQKVK